MKKLSFIICVVLLSSVATHAQSRPALTQPKARYSSEWMPISGPQIQTQVRQNANNALALRQLWWRARLQDVVWYYVLALRDVVKTQPSNAVALSAYCFTLLDCRVYQATPSYQRAKADLGDELEISGIRHLLEKAKQLDPKQWAIWMTESAILHSEPGDMSTLGENTEKLARRAVQLSNNPFTNEQLAYALLSRSMWDKDPRYLNYAIIACKRAQKLDPVHIGPSMLLLSIYRNYKKDKAAIQLTQQAILATLPPGIALSPLTQQYLKSKGIIVS